MSRFVVSLTEDEDRAFEQMAAAAFPGLEKGAKAALFRQWLWEKAETDGLEIEQRTVYGDASRFKSDEQ